MIKNKEILFSLMSIALMVLGALYSTEVLYFVKNYFLFSIFLSLLAYAIYIISIDNGFVNKGWFFIGKPRFYGWFSVIYCLLVFMLFLAAFLKG